MVSLIAIAGCEGVLDPLDGGQYTDENMGEYPSLIRGFVDKAYVQLDNNYRENQYIYLDGATDDAVITSPTNAMHKLALGTLKQTDDPFKTYWSRDYTGIFYCNKFLKDNIGLNTQYLVNHQQDSILRHNYHGDAYGLRAWFQYDLLKKFGGWAENGQLLGVPIILEDFDQNTADQNRIGRNTYDECVQQILDDCDSALVYLPYANRDWCAENLSVQGAMRWQKLDQVSIIALKALVYLMWASDAYNPDNDVTRWEKAAEYAAQAIMFKLEKDGTHGFDPKAPVDWMDPNSPEMYWASRAMGAGNTMEASQYPNAFRGSALYAPTQELVDAFPMANGYPITDYRSGYDPSNPYEGRDPRFYSTIFHHGSQVIRTSNSEIMFIFDTKAGGRDMNGLTNNGLTNYYLKKYVYLEWNRNDKTVQQMPRCVFLIRWTDMLLAFAEASNRAYGPVDSRFGISAKEAIRYIRARTTPDGQEGIAAQSDPYLEECAYSTEMFEALVRNERRLETCFEGKRFFDLSRWNIPLYERNATVHRVEITGTDDDLDYEYVEADMRNLSSASWPIPYTEMVNADALVQNVGWESWK